MIPKIIHYCWFGGNPLPPLALECIASWRKFLPGFEIWQWTDFNDNDNVNACKDDHDMHADDAPAGRRSRTGSFQRVSEANNNEDEASLCDYEDEQKVDWNK